MLTFRLLVEGEKLLEFRTVKPNIELLRVKPKDDLLECNYKYIDKSIIDMVFNCDQYLPIAVGLSIDPEHVDRVSKLMANLAQQAPDCKFFYLDDLRKEEYLIHFEFSFCGDKTTSLKLIKLVPLDSAEQDVQTMENRIAQLKERQNKLEDMIEECHKETENFHKKTEECKREEAIRSAETEEHNTKLAEVKQKLSQIPKNDDIIRELLQEKDQLTKMLANITREQQIKRKETLDSLAKRYETLKTDMMGELNKSLNEYIESEKKQKSQLKQSMAKQGQSDSAFKEVKQTVKEKLEELNRLQKLIDTRQRKKSTLEQAFQENSDYVEIGLCKLCHKNLANVVNFPCHHFGDVCFECNRKTQFENRCIKCWSQVEFYEAIKYV